MPSPKTQDFGEGLASIPGSHARNRSSEQNIRGTVKDSGNPARLPAPPEVANWRRAGGFSARRRVGLTGFEPATSWSRTKRSSQAELQPVVAD
jgi:hypothetical protein